MQLDYELVPDSSTRNEWTLRAALPAGVCLESVALWCDGCSSDSEAEGGLVASLPVRSSSSGSSSSDGACGRAAGAGSVVVVLSGPARAARRLQVGCRVASVA